MSFDDKNPHSRQGQALPFSKGKMMILVASPLTEDIYQRIGARELAAHFEIVIADCLDWVRRFDNRPDFSKVESDEIVHTADLASFQALIGAFVPDFVLDFVGRGALTRLFQTECRRVGAMYIAHHLVPLPVATSSLRRWTGLLRHPWKAFGKAVRYLARHAHNSNPYPPDVALVAGSKGLNSWLLSARAVIRTATPAYFELKRARAEWEAGAHSELGLPRGGYILFIDDCLALSFDFRLGDFAPIISADEYHSVLNGFFDRLTRATGLPVVIAGHPNGKEYRGYATLFGGRHVCFGRTAELSYGCSYALTHFSSAINFPVLLRKPIAIMVFDRLRKAPQGELATVIASILQRPTLDIQSTALEDGLLAKAIAQPVDDSAYEAYTKAHIVDTVSPGANPFENLTNYLQSLRRDGAAT